MAPGCICIDFPTKGASHRGERKAERTSTCHPAVHPRSLLSPNGFTALGLTVSTRHPHLPHVPQKMLKHSPAGTALQHLLSNLAEVGNIAPHQVRRRAARQGDKGQDSTTPPAQGRPNQRALAPHPSYSLRLHSWLLFLTFHFALSQREYVADPDSNYKVQTCQTVNIL